MSQGVAGMSYLALTRQPAAAPASDCRPLSPPLPSRGLVPTVFHEAWWLAVASQGRYREAEVRSGDAVVGRLPYVATGRFGMTHIGMPLLTHFLGPAITEGNGGEAVRRLHRLSVTKALIGQLPKASNVYIKHHRGVSETIAFKALGFRTEVQFNLEIAPAAPEILWRRMRDKTRNVIRRAEERFEVVDVNDAAKFMEFYQNNLREKRLSTHYDPHNSILVVREALRREAGRLLVARDQQGEWKAAIFTLRDPAVEYFLMSTRAGDSGNGAVSLLLWTAIQGAAARGAIFDFDGVGKDGAALLFVGFGGEICSRLISYRSSVASRILNRAFRIGAA